MSRVILRHFEMFITRINDKIDENATNMWRKIKPAKMTFVGYVTFEILDDELLGLARLGERRLQPDRTVRNEKGEVVPFIVFLALFAIARFSAFRRHGVSLQTRAVEPSSRPLLPEVISKYRNLIGLSIADWQISDLRFGILISGEQKRRAMSVGRRSSARPQLQMRRSTPRRSAQTLYFTCIKLCS